VKHKYDGEKMNKTLNTVLLVLAILVLAGGIFFTGTMYARSNAFYGSNMMSGGMMNGQGGVNIIGGGGMMNGNRANMMGGYNNSNVAPLTIDQAKVAAEKYIKVLDVSGLEISEVMIFDNNAYVVVKETESGMGAFELLVDPASQIAYPEHGPNMMWNVKYGGLNHQYMMGSGSGMMGSGNGMMQGMMDGLDGTVSSNVSGAMTVTPEQAIAYAQTYLDANIAGATAASNPITFYGYYTLDFEKDGKVAGMLSVNGYSGQVFLHTWHGTFIEEAE
jgi:hypothetical protein